MSGFDVAVYQGRTADFAGSLYREDGVTGQALVAQDKLRFKAGVGPAVPLLDLVSGTPTVAGSGVFIDALGAAVSVPTLPYGTPAAYRVRLAQGDTAGLAEGSYDAEVILVDSGAGGLAKTVSRGVLHVLPAPAGSTG